MLTAGFVFGSPFVSVVDDFYEANKLSDTGSEAFFSRITRT